LRQLSIRLLVLLLAVLPLLGAFAGGASAAATSRVAVIKELKGTVKVKKAGGTREFTAFAKMSLNEGDILTTGKDAHAELQFANGTSEDDRMTVAANTSLSFSRLTDRGGTRTKVSMLKGSAWVDVKSIATKEDEFRLETPTSIMGVRGTHFLASVNPVTGETLLSVLSGVVRASGMTGTDYDAERKALQNGKFVNVYPAQQISLFPPTAQGPAQPAHPSVAQVADIVQQMPANTIGKIIEAFADIQRENEELKKKMLQSLSAGDTSNLPRTQDGPVNSQEELDRIAQNIDNLIGNIAKEALNQNKIDNAKLQALIDEANKKIQDPAKQLDLSKTKPLQPDSKPDPELEKAKQAAKAAEEKYKAEQQRQEELRQKQAALVAKLEAEKKALDEANKKAEQAAREKAAEKLKAQLDAAARAEFEKNQKAREQELNPQPSPSPGSSGNQGPGPVDPPPQLPNGVTSWHTTTASSGTDVVWKKLRVAENGIGGSDYSYSTQVAESVDELLLDISFAEETDKVEIRYGEEYEGSYDPVERQPSGPAIALNDFALPLDPSLYSHFLIVYTSNMGASDERVDTIELTVLRGEPETTHLAMYGLGISYAETQSLDAYELSETDYFVFVGAEVRPYGMISLIPMIESYSKAEVKLNGTAIEPSYMEYRIVPEDGWNEVVIRIWDLAEQYHGAQDYKIRIWYGDSVPSAFAVSDFGVVDDQNAAVHIAPSPDNASLLYAEVTPNASEVRFKPSLPPGTEIVRVKYDSPDGPLEAEPELSDGSYAIPIDSRGGDVEVSFMLRAGAREFMYRVIVMGEVVPELSGIKMYSSSFTLLGNAEPVNDDYVFMVQGGVFDFFLGLDIHYDNDRIRATVNGVPVRFYYGSRGSAGPFDFTELTGGAKQVQIVLSSPSGKNQTSYTLHVYPGQGQI